MSCAIHADENDAWLSGRIADSMTAAGGNNVILAISTEQELNVSLSSDISGGSLVLDSNAGASCTTSIVAIVGSAASVEFDCPLLSHPTEPTSGCGVRGSVTFENCDSE